MAFHLQQQPQVCFIFWCACPDYQSANGFLGDAQTMSVINSVNPKHWPRIAIVVGGSITVPSVGDSLQASNAIQFSVPKDASPPTKEDASKSAPVEGLPYLYIAVPQKWDFENQFKVSTNDKDSSPLIVANSEKEVTYTEKANYIKCAGVCLDVDAEKHMRILLK